MVSTLSPKASDTPSRPMPTSGKAAAITALPQPAKVSQNVPIASARHLCMVLLCMSSSCRSYAHLLRERRRQSCRSKEAHREPRSDAGTLLRLADGYTSGCARLGSGSDHHEPVTVMSH